MSDLKNINPDNEEEIESPIDGPPPDWMKTATSSAGSSFKENDAPEWLRNIRAGKGTTAESQAESGAVGDESEASSAETMSDLERLLAEEGIDLTGVADERPEGAEGMSVKDWMIATSDDEIIRRKIGAEPVEEPPAPAPQVEAEPLPEAPAAAPKFTEDVVEEELPDWLREISDEVETSPPLAAVAEARPVTAKPVVEEQRPGDEDLPDWLREVSEQVQASTPPAVSDTGPVEGQDELMPEEGLPDWLQGISDEPAPVAEPIVETDLAAGLEDTGVDEEMPAWLQEVEEEEESPFQAVTATSDDKLVVTDELPSWLREVEEDQVELPAVTAETEPEPILPEQPPEIEADILEEELPDWLREDEVSALETDLGLDFEPAPYTMTDSTDTAIDEENLPDWLRDVQEAEVKTEAELPELMEAEAEVEEELDEIEEAELPDWLKEVQAEEEETITPAVTPPMAVESVPLPLEAEAEVVEEELPDWLREAQAETAEGGPELGAARAEVGEGLPDWLQGVEMAEEEPFEPSEPSPDEFGFGAVEGEEVEPALVQEELPDWLKEVQVESEEMVVLEEATVAEVAGPELEQSLVEETELPDWLQVEEEAEAEFPAEPILPEPEPAVAAVAVPEFVAPAEPKLEEAEPILAEVPAPVVTEEVAPPVHVASPGLADMPDWLKKLREGDVEEEEVAVLPVKPLPKPVVAGPMVGSTVAPEPEPPVEVAIPEEASERLEQARAARDAGNIDEALQYYENLVSSGLQLDRVIEDIKQTVKSYPANAMLYQVMGDAMMKDGRLQSALDAYRTALSKL